MEVRSSFKPRDMAKFGLLYLNKACGTGQQVVTQSMGRRINLSELSIGPNLNYPMAIKVWATGVVSSLAQGLSGQGVQRPNTSSSGRT